MLVSHYKVVQLKARGWIALRFGPDMHVPFESK